MARADGTANASVARDNAQVPVVDCPQLDCLLVSIAFLAGSGLELCLPIKQTMAAPSFSSFQPPSFSSFPDLEQGPSKRGAEPSRDDERRTKRSRDKQDHDDQSKKHKHHRSHRKDRHTSEDRSSRRKGPSGEDRDSRRHDRLREREKGRDRDDSRDPGKSVEMRSALDDERIKEEEDRTRHHGELPPSQVDLTRPLFYSDKKGDALNVRYGGLYAGDVPKYRLVGCTSFVSFMPGC